MTIDSRNLSKPYIKFMVASEFKDIAVALDNNLFVANDFDGVTIKWRGGHFFRIETHLRIVSLR